MKRLFMSCLRFLLGQHFASVGNLVLRRFTVAASHLLTESIVPLVCLFYCRFLQVKQTSTHRDLSKTTELFSMWIKVKVSQAQDIPPTHTHTSTKYSGEFVRIIPALWKPHIYSFEAINFSANPVVIYIALGSTSTHYKTLYPPACVKKEKSPNLEIAFGFLQLSVNSIPGSFCPHVKVAPIRFVIKYVICGCMPASGHERAKQNQSPNASVCDSLHSSIILH